MTRLSIRAGLQVRVSPLACSTPVNSAQAWPATLSDRGHIGRWRAGWRGKRGVSCTRWPEGWAVQCGVRGDLSLTYVSRCLWGCLIAGVVILKDTAMPVCCQAVRQGGGPRGRDSR